MEPGEYAALAAAEDRMWWFQAAHALIAAALAAAPLPAGPVLDAGCGTGGLLRRLSVVWPDRPVIGLDLSPDALAWAAQAAPSGLVAGSVNDLPFADDSLAAILSVDVLCHRNVDPAAALREAARCLRPGGVLILNLPAYPWLLSAHDREVHNVRRFVRGDVAGLLAPTGLRLRRATHWNAVLLAPLVVWRLTLGRRAGASDVKPYPGPLDRVFGWLLAAERAWLRRADLAAGSSILVVAVKPVEGDHVP